jgi:DNA-binding transcriptional LysR family regulator
MELFQARYFVAVGEQLSFRRAAEGLHVSPSSLSVQVRKLENEIGAELLIREGHYVKLTEAGRVFLKEARQFLDHAARSVSLARRAAKGDLSLTVGYNTVAEFTVLPWIVAAFKKGWPQTRLTLRSLKTPEQFAALSCNELDLGFICPPVPSDEFEVRELGREPFVVVLPTEHPLAREASVSFSSLSREPLILYSRVLDPDSYRQIEREFRLANAVMNVVYELESSPAMIHFVAAGNGCCIAPEYVCGIRREGVVCKPLEPNSIVRTLAVAKRKDSTALADSLYRFAIDHFVSEASKSAVNAFQFPSLPAADSDPPGPRRRASSPRARKARPD